METWMAKTRGGGFEVKTVSRATKLAEIKNQKCNRRTYSGKREDISQEFRLKTSTYDMNIYLECCFEQAK